MSNKAIINDKDIVDIVMDGDIKYEKLINFFISVGSLSNSIDAEGKDVLLLIDMSAASSIEPLAKKLITTMFTVSIFDKLAVIGATKQVKADMEDIAIGSHREKKIKAFTSKELANDWLLSK